MLFADRIHGQFRFAVQFFEHTLNARLVFLDAVADLHLDHAIIGIEKTPHLGAQFLDAFALLVITTC